VRVVGPGGYWVSDDKSKINVHRVHAWISRENYWAAGRSYAVMARSIEQALRWGFMLLTMLRLASPGWSPTAPLSPASAMCSSMPPTGAAAWERSWPARPPAILTLLVSGRLMAEPGRSMYRKMGFGVLVSPERWMERPGGDP
jgi:hypothetical protein